MGEDFPLETQVTGDIRGKRRQDTDDTKTQMTLRHAGIPMGVMRDMTNTGYNESLDKLAEVVEGKQ